MNSKLRYLLFNKGWKSEFSAKRNHWTGKLSIGNNSKIGESSLVERYNGGNLSIGNNTVISRKCKISTCGGNISIGNGVTIGDGCIITAQGNVSIEDDIIFADNVTVIANEHIYNDISTPIKFQGEYSKAILIKSGAWIGVNVTILQGTVIGKNCVVGAGSIVKGEFPDYCVIAGNPAKIIKYYDEKVGKWVKNN